MASQMLRLQPPLGSERKSGSPDAVAQLPSMSSRSGYAGGATGPVLAGTRPHVVISTKFKETRNGRSVENSLGPAEFTPSAGRPGVPWLEAPNYTTKRDLQPKHPLEGRKRREGERGVVLFFFQVVGELSFFWAPSWQDPWLAISIKVKEGLERAGCTVYNPNTDNAELCRAELLKDVESAFVLSADPVETG